ncbi:MAG: bifunctional (p)ppGpp synthetase/guanosine-3',5'-bis(diphosphate) 3'-pyrophosphohydrolase [Desulfovibrio sp.]|mgnify:CR=1 FL=1|nr:MAG: bifunctional (p)ppGpp synthetase/guanosine-3',5'-bis(diphosphate) 3'-pyrophosphohydrolase [Desulfovibrio sp.]
MVRINEILDKVRDYASDKGVALIQKAYVFSAAAHAGQTRRSGEPYLSHPLEVTNVLAEMKLDEATIAAGLLHDTVEDTKASIEDIDAQFGEEVADIVDGVTKISQITFDSKEEAQAENIRKMILAMAENIRVLMVKLADRLHNMRTLEHMPAPKRMAIARETLDIYAPLANRLGLHRVQVELEDLSFKYVKPDIFEQMSQGVRDKEIVGKEYVDKVVALLEKTLKKNKIKGRIRGRNKHLYSIHRKMLQQNLTLDEVHDLVAFRVVVNNVKDCYAVLGLVHSMWMPVHGRFKDYISMPKANMYQSLHTTVIGPDGERIEIQIRTEDMHRLAEYGVAAHWLYKDGGKLREKDVGQFAWLRRILDWQKEESDSREFMRSLRFDLFKDEVYVFTPQGEVKELPEGATPVDFAYLIHTEVGDHCTGAKVNGRLVTLSTELKNGDTIEIITDAHRNPSRDWLKFVKTAKARTRINHYLRTVERARSIALAKEMLEKEGRKMGINVAKVLKEERFLPIAEEFSFQSVEHLLSAVGYSRITPRKVLHRLQAHEQALEQGIDPAPMSEQDAAEEAARLKAAEEERAKSADTVTIKGVDNVLVRFAGCCNPLPGDAIVGYISRGRGVTVHTLDCPNVQTVEPERLLEVSWGTEADQPYRAKIRVLCKNERGVLAEVGHLLAEEEVNIDSGSILSNVDGNTEMVFTVEVRDSAHLYQANAKLNGLASVIEAIRVTAS